MSNETVAQVQKQFESVVGAPARTYASLVLDHFEQIAKVQTEAAKAYADTTFKQFRTAMDVKDPSDVRAYVENQQKVAQELGERVKGDAEKVVSLNQAFVEKAQKVAQDSAKSASAAAGQAK